MSRIHPLLGSQGPCSALIAFAKMTHFLPLCSKIWWGRGQSCKKWGNKIIWFVTAILPHNWCQIQILHPKRRARLFQICYKYISGGKTYLGCFLVSLPWYTMIYSWVNLVCPRIEGGYFSAISGQKFYLTTVLRSCWPLEWRRRGFITSKCLKKNLL